MNPEIRFIPPQSNNEIADKILNFLNAKGDPEQINSYYSQFQSKTLDVQAVDMNDDGLEEIVIVGALPWELNSSGNGSIIILGCKQRLYEIVKQFDFQNISSAKVLRIEKLLADYPQQVIIHYRPISGWGSDILALGYMNGDWQVVFRDSQFSPELVVFDQENDDNKEISIHSLSTATQGPQRKMISTFKWDGEQYTLISTQLMPGTTRVEYLDDAQGALDNGDISMAIAYYERAAYDPDLDNFPSQDEFMQKQTNVAGDYQISFALFRLAVLWFSVEDFENAEVVIADLEEDFPPNLPGNEFTQAAKIFKDQIDEGKTLNGACSAVSGFLSQSYPELNTHIGDWGVSVIGYTRINELCPFH